MPLYEPTGEIVTKAIEMLQASIEAFNTKTSEQTEAIWQMLATTDRWYR